MYRLARGLLFTIDAERVHELTIEGLERLSRHQRLCAQLAARVRVDDDRLKVRVFDTEFPNPIGLAAGLDKDGRAVAAWHALGFGFAEVGSVTAEPQPGNPEPRLFRLPADEALVNRMGFNNRGARALAARLADLRERSNVPIPVFVNVGKSRSAALEDAAADYREALEQVWPVADGVVVNVSSPNTPGLRRLQAPELLAPILAQLVSLRQRRPLPVLLKLAPDLSDEELTALARLAEESGVDGLVAVNTTLARPPLHSQAVPEGGLSGRPLAARAIYVLRLLSAATRLPIVSTGGVFDAADAIARLRAGASLLEIYTGFIYRGPLTVRTILRGVLEHLDEQGLPDVASLVGTDVRN